VVTTPGLVTGRKVAIIADSSSDLAGIAKLSKALEKAGVVPMITAPVGGQLKSGRRSLVVERTFTTARSIEFDAAVIAGGALEGVDIKLAVLLHEMFRHCKPVGAWGDGRAVLESVDIALDGPGVISADDASTAFGEQLLAALGLHRVWERADAVMASAVPPVLTKTRRSRKGGKS
jgi:catalase